MDKRENTIYFSDENDSLCVGRKQQCMQCINTQQTGHGCWSGATITYMTSGLVLSAPFFGYKHWGHNCWYMASVTDISVGSAQTTTYVLASQLQLFQTYLLVRCNTSRHACWWCAIVTDMPGGTVQL